jgi:hypothetical protein
LDDSRCFLDDSRLIMDDFQKIFDSYLLIQYEFKRVLDDIRRFSGTV